MAYIGALVGDRPLRVDPLDRRGEPHFAATVEELGDQVTDQVLLRVHGVDLATAQPAVLQLELHVVAAERARVVLLPVRVQPRGEAVLGQDADAVRRQEPRAGTVFDVFAGLAFQDQAVDSLRTQQVAEHQAGRPSTDDQHGGQFSPSERPRPLRLTPPYLRRTV